MVLTDITADKSSSKVSKLNLLEIGVKDKSTTFADLLTSLKNKSGVGETKNLLKVKSDKIVVTPQSKETLHQDISLLNPETTTKLSKEDLKVLVEDAKTYLKQVIVDSDGYKKAISKDLPKTLSGLKELAKVYDIDVSKISLEDVKVSKNTQQPKDEVSKVTSQIKPQKEQKEEPVKIKSLQQPRSEFSKVQSPLKLKSQSNQKSTQVQQTTSVLNQKHLKVDAKLQTKPKVKAQTSQLKEQKSTQLFTTKTQPAPYTTTQVLQTKAPVEVKQVKQLKKTQTQDMLSSLLGGKKTVNTQEQFTQSILSSQFVDMTDTKTPDEQTAIQTKVVSLESVLIGKIDNDENINSKIDGLNIHKSDSLEVKMNEAKQMVKYLSQDIKQSIEEYKSPFTRVKLQLNPKSMGEVDLTIVQRGKNLHINLSSNNTAIQTLATNANELRTQLNNSGINNASLNFNNNSQSSDSSFDGQHQNSQQNQKAKSEYGYFENEEKNEEIVNSLEIIVPYYA